MAAASPKERLRHCRCGLTSTTICWRFCAERDPSARWRRRGGVGLTPPGLVPKVSTGLRRRRTPHFAALGMESTRWSRLALLYASTIFLSAFLLFQVQPLISRFILPWFGGGPAVWTTSLLFFQTVLFAGYAYAHASEQYFRPRVRTVVHLTLLVAALLTLPITPSDWWKPADSDSPTTRILVLLTICVGLPYFVLSSTGPLVQAWFSQTLPGRSPYRLYALSNFGSLLALLSYPFVFEPALDGNAQSLWWSAGFLLFCLMCGTACWLTARLGGAAVAAAASKTEVRAAASAIDEPPPSWNRRLLWLALPAFASIFLLATTNHACQDMSPVPFLWVAPLSLYLLSFIIAFDHERWYRRLPFALAALIAIYLTVGMYNADFWARGWLGHLHNWIWGTPETLWVPQFSYVANICSQFAGLFLLCMLCHGELVRLRPAPRYLTSFYLMISAGGALGGLSVSVIAPQIFDTYAEWKLGLVAGFVLAATVAFVLVGSTGAKLPGGSSPRRRWLSRWGAMRAGGLAVSVLALLEIVLILENDDLGIFGTLERTRNFYGVLSVVKGYSQEPPLPYHMFFSGRIQHGVQYNDPLAQRMPTSYFTERSGIGVTLDFYRQAAAAKQPLRVGIIGLGVGTLACYVNRPGQMIRFYEINPAVPRVADRYFTYLADARDAGVSVDIVLGDGRLALEREAKESPQDFDVLAMDAFSGDSVPVHLLTREAWEIYFQHLDPQGALGINISNRHLNLAPVVYGLADYFEYDAVEIMSADWQHLGLPAEWMIVTRNQELLEKLRAVEGNTAPERPKAPLPLWTDQRHNLMEILW
jgi:hypothetical protein